MTGTVDESSDRLEALFAEALEREAGERARFLDEACGADETLRRELAELLAAHDAATGFFDDLSAEIVTAAGAEVETAARPRVRIGPYRALRLLGHGGMGAVYLAVRADGEFEQEVALKLLHLDMETPETRARFLSERQLLARLSHPHIARLLDGGVTEEGRPYFAMEYVEGTPITTYCRSRELPVEAMLALFLDVIEAVSYLHRNLIVHRDLKPSNILVDGAGQVKLLDFGIAKLLAEEAGAGGRTRTGQQLLTPQYAAPEQLANDPVTTATDVYALGVVLYELLTGSRPHERAALDLAALQNEDTAPPSVFRQGLSRDLDTICLKALRPEPQRRYASAEQLGQDIERYLQGLPVRARPSTWGYRVGRFMRRNRGGVAVAALLAALVLTGFIAERRLRSEAETARALAQEEAAKAVAVSDFLAELLSSVDPARAQGRDVSVSDVLAEASRRLESGSHFADRPTDEAALRLTIGRTYMALSRHEEAEPHLLRALELRGGPDAGTPEALAASAALGVLRFRSGEREKAEPILRRVLARRLEVLGEEHPDTLESMGDLADLYWYQQRLDEVEALDRHTLAVRRRVLGEEHPDTLRAANGLATTLYSLGRYGEAAERFAEALAGQEAQLGADHPETLRLVHNLGATLTELGRYEEAERLGSRAVEGRRRVLGATHGDTATALHNLGLALFHLGRLEEADAVLGEAIEVRSRDDGLSAYWYSMSWLADLRRAQDRLDEGEEIYRRSIEGLSAVDGPGAATTLRVISALASLELERGRVAEAEAGVDSALERQLELLGPEHPETLESRLVLARVRRAQGRPQEAVPLAREVQEVAARTLGEHHPLTRRADALLGGLAPIDG